ncbi:MAG: putative toxin-antitoxin system toxin component, PIN family [Cyclobacteriaceae bacterium]|jgi:putative PIN family toxin of toxin-antitoxin system|nr:putative toxin-antitoxin system toxin component, PIN family [Cyclobacteriaceae bacterium]
MLFVIDTSVLISAALGDGICRAAFEMALRKGDIIRSDETFFELARTLEKPRLQKYLDQQDKVDFLSNYLMLTNPVTITTKVYICRDPYDNMFLELALSGKANYLITRDGDLLTLDPFQSIPIVSVSRFLNEMSNYPDKE